MTTRKKAPAKTAPKGRRNTPQNRAENGPGLPSGERSVPSTGTYSPQPRVTSQGGSQAVGQFVLLSDLHAHPWAAFATGAGRDNTRLRSSIRTLDASLATAQRLHVPWVFAGDLVHTAGYALNVVLAELMAVFKRYPTVEKLAVWGNHDARGIGGRIAFDQTVWAAFSHLERLTILDPSVQGAAVTVPGCALSFSGAGYQPRIDLLEYGANADVGIYHQTVSGSQAPGGFVLEEGVDPVALLARHRMVAVGHVHHWQYVDAQKHGVRVLIPGSPEHQNFGDAGDHGWWVVTVTEKDIEHEFHAGGSPQFLTVGTLRDVKKDGNFYRVQAVGVGEEVPDYATIAAPTVTNVVSRGTLRGLTGDAILEAWLKEMPLEIDDVTTTDAMNAGREFIGAASGAGTVRALRLMELSLFNFCSHEETELKITPGARLVLGQGKDYPSNGAGKSTIFEALFWVLFGTTTKGQDSADVVRWGTDEACVQAHFKGEDVEWLNVTRWKGKSSRLEVMTQAGPMEAASSTELTQQLLEYLGLTPELFKALAYFSQEKLMLFASATDGQRKEMLADLIGASMYQSAAERANKASSEAEIKRATTAEVQAYAQQQVSQLNAQLTQSIDAAATWELGWNERVAVARFKLEQFDAGFDALYRHMVTRQVEQTREENVARRLEAEFAYNRIGAWLKTQPEPPPMPDLAALNTALRDATRARESAMYAVRAALDQHTAASAHKQKLEEGLTCPTCKRPLPEADRLRAVEEAQRAVDAKWAVLEHARTAMIAATPIAEAAEAAVHAGNVAVEIARVYREQQAVAQSHWLTLNQLDQQLKMAEQIAGTTVTEQLMTRREGIEREVASALGETNPYASRVEAQRASLAEQSSRITLLVSQWLEYVRAAAIADYWRKGFSKQGIQSLLMDEVAGQFNLTRSRILPALTQGVYDVQFSTISLTQKGEVREKTEFKIYEHGTEVPYEALSGGQRRRVDIGVMLTLVLSIAEWMQTPGLLGVLILDEVFSFLDDSGAEGLMEALREMQQRIPAIFVIDHHANLQSMFSETIFVQQGEDGVSRVVQS